MIKAAFVILDAASGETVRILPFQYNPQLLVHNIEAEVETFALVAEYDAADKLEAADTTVSQYGIAPHLAALRATAVPDSSTVVVFAWNSERMVPVTVVSMTITETMHDARLNPLAATVAIELAVSPGSAAEALSARLAGAYESAQQSLVRIGSANPLTAAPTADLRALTGGS